MTLGCAGCIAIAAFFCAVGHARHHTLTRGELDFDYRIADTVKALYSGLF
jgi:hypothetical protein